MPRTKITETVLYKFSELSEDAKQTAVSELWDINLDYDSWQSTYEDAENIGIKITGFELERGRSIDGKFIEYPENVATNIIKEHGQDCGTYKTAKKFIDNMNIIRVKCKLLGEDADCDFEDEEEELNEQFKKDILNDYLNMLDNEYQYLESKAAIIETIEANEYEFEKDGTRAWRHNRVF